MPAGPVAPTGPVGPVVPVAPLTGTSREIIPVNGSIYIILIAVPTTILGRSIYSVLNVSVTIILETDLSVDKFVSALSLVILPKLLLIFILFLFYIFIKFLKILV